MEMLKCYKGLTLWMRRMMNWSLRRRFLCVTLPRIVEMRKKEGYTHCVLFDNDLSETGVSVRDVEKWCEENGLSYTVVQYDEIYNIQIRGIDIRLF